MLSTMASAAARAPSCTLCASSLHKQSLHGAIAVRRRMCQSTASRKGRQAEAEPPTAAEPPSVPSGAVRVDPSTAEQPVEKDMWEVKVAACSQPLRLHS